MHNIIGEQTMLPLHAAQFLEFNELINNYNALRSALSIHSGKTSISCGLIERLQLEFVGLFEFITTYKSWVFNNRDALETEAMFLIHELGLRQLPVREELLIIQKQLSIREQSSTDPETVQGVLPTNLKKCPHPDDSIFLVARGFFKVVLPLAALIENNRSDLTVSEKVDELTVLCDRRNKLLRECRKNFLAIQDGAQQLYQMFQKNMFSSAVSEQPSDEEVFLLELSESHERTQKLMRSIEKTVFLEEKPMLLLQDRERIKRMEQQIRAAVMENPERHNLHDLEKEEKVLIENIIKH